MSFLPILANYRNLCAHEDILYDHKTATIIDNNKFHGQLDIPQRDGEYMYGKNDLFALLIIMKFLLIDEEFRLLIKEIDYEKNILEGKLETISIEDVFKKMGFPLNYTQLMDFDK